MPASPTNVDITHHTPLSPTHTDEDPIPPKSEPNSTTTLSAKTFIHQLRLFLLRTIAFILLEAGFAVLVVMAALKPIPLNPSPKVTANEAKTALTLISFIWQATAIFLAKDILLYIFSSEWAIQYHSTGQLTPGETDIVSRLTAGLLMQIQHFGSKKATMSFRVVYPPDGREQLGNESYHDQYHFRWISNNHYRDLPQGTDQLTRKRIKDLERRAT